MGRYFCSRCRNCLYGERFPSCSGCDKDVCDSCSNWQDCDCCGEGSCDGAGFCSSCLTEVDTPAWACCGEASGVVSLCESCQEGDEWDEDLGEKQDDVRDHVKDAYAGEKSAAERHGCRRCGACGEITCVRVDECLGCARKALKAARKAAATAEAAGLPHDLPLVHELYKTAQCPSLKSALATWLQQAAKQPAAPPAVAPAPPVVAKAPSADEILRRARERASAAGGLLGAPTRKRSSR